MTPADLDAFAAVMIARRIRRARGFVPPAVAEEEDEEFEIEMDPSAFPAVINPLADITPSTPDDLGAPEKCDCGHEADAEHNNGGLCYRGCPTSLCHPETVKEAVRGP